MTPRQLMLVAGTFALALFVTASAPAADQAQSESGTIVAAAEGTLSLNNSGNKLFQFEVNDKTKITLNGKAANWTTWRPALNARSNMSRTAKSWSPKP